MRGTGAIESPTVATTAGDSIAVWAADAQVTHTESDGDVMRDLSGLVGGARRAPWQPVDMIAADELVPRPEVVVTRDRTPRTIEEWQAVADRLLSNRCCAFHRSDLVALRMDLRVQPACFKWTAMAAIASHHVRLALYPLRLHTDRGGYLDLRQGGSSRLLTADVHTIRSTNNAIYDDIFWVHLAYVSAEDGIERLRALLRPERHYAPVLAGFEAIDRGRRVLEHDGVDGRSSDGG